MSFWRRRRADLVVGLALLALAVMAVGPGLLPGRTPLPLDVLGLFEPWRIEWPTAANPIVGDAVLQFSSRVYMAATLKSGHFPLWNPTVMAGHPHVGDTHSSPFYPLLLLLAWLFPPLTAYALQLVLQMWLGGLFMYAWMRQLALGRLPSVVAAVAWMLAGVQQIWLPFPPFPGTLNWLPAIPAAWEYGRQTGRWRGVALGALALGMAITAGQVQFVLYGLALLAAYTTLRLAANPRNRRRDAGAALGIAALGVALGAVHLLPVYELARDTIRPPFSLAALVETGVPLRQLVTAIAPWFLGHPRAGDYRGAQNASEMMLYVGLTPLMLTLVAWYVRRDRLAATFSLLCLVVAAIALATPLAWPLAFTPWLQRFGLMRWLALWPLMAAPLSALALDAAMRNASAARRLARSVVLIGLLLMVLLLAAAARDHAGEKVVAALALLAVSVAVLLLFARRPESRGVGLAVVGVVAVDLLALGQGYLPSAVAASYFPAMPPLDRILVDRSHEPFRIAEFQRDAIAIGPSVAPSLGLDEIGGYTSSVRESYRRFIAALSTPTTNGYLAVNPNMVTLSDASPLLLRLLNVRYILAAGDLSGFDRPLDAPAACAHTRTLSPGETLGATVLPWADGLNRIDIAVAFGGPVAVHLVDAPGATDHRAYDELAAGSSPVRSAYFDPITQSANRPYYVYVDIPTGSTDRPPAVCLDGDALAVGLGATEAPYTRAFGANGLNVYRAPEGFGQAWVVPAAVTAKDQAEALAQLASGVLDPAEEVLLEQAQVTAAALSVSSSVSSSVSPSVSVPTSLTHLPLRNDGPNVRRLTLPARAAGWLVVSESWAPGWQAEVDGRSQPVLRADGGIMALPLANGGREVVLRYRPLSVTVGAIISLMALAIVLLVLWRERRSRQFTS